jgi:hypothetical protein
MTHRAHLLLAAALTLSLGLPGAADVDVKSPTGNAWMGRYEGKRSWREHAPKFLDLTRVTAKPEGDKLVIRIETAEPIKPPAKGICAYECFFSDLNGTGGARVVVAVFGDLKRFRYASLPARSGAWVLEHSAPSYKRISAARVGKAGNVLTITTPLTAELAPDRLWWVKARYYALGPKAMGDEPDYSVDDIGRINDPTPKAQVMVPWSPPIRDTKDKHVGSDQPIIQPGRERGITAPPRR